MKTVKQPKRLECEECVKIGSRWAEGASVSCSAMPDHRETPLRSTPIISLYGTGSTRQTSVVSAGSNWNPYAFKPLTRRDNRGYES